MSEAIIHSLEIARNVARKLIESYEKHGDRLPVNIKAPDNQIDIDIALGIH